MSSLSILIDIIKKHGILIGCFVLIVICIINLFRILMDEDRAAIFRAKINKSLYSLSGKKSHEKAYIANDLKGRLNYARRSMHFGSDTFPELSRIEWIDGTEVSSYNISDDEYVIRLDSMEDQDINIIRMTETMVKRTALIGIRHIVTQPISRSIDSTLTRKLLLKIGNSQAFTKFYAESDSHLGNTEYCDWYKKVRSIDDYGLFERLMLVELQEFSRRVHGLEMRPFMIGAVENFVKWLYRLATRESGEKVPLEYPSAYMTVSIVLVGEVEKVLEKDNIPYLEAVDIGIEKEVDAIYVIQKNMHTRCREERRMNYKHQCNRIYKLLKKDKRLYTHYDIKYDYIDKDRKRQGRIARFTINQSED